MCRFIRSSGHSRCHSFKVGVFLALAMLRFQIATLPVLNAQENSDTGVAPKTVQGTPDDASLTAQVAWARTMVTDDKGTPKMPNPYPMQINLDLSGEGINNICGFGMIVIKNAAVKGGKIKFVPLLPDVDPSKNIFPFRPSQPANQDDADLVSGPFKHPVGTLRVPLKFEPPIKGQAKIDALDGSVKLIMSEQSTDVVLQDLVKLSQRPNDPALKDANLKLGVSKNSSGRDQFVLSGGKGTYVGQATAVVKTKLSKSLRPLQRIIDKGQLVQVYVPESDDPLNELKIEVKVFSNVQEKTVTFKFADLPLPSADSKPTERELRREIFGIN